MERVSTLRVEDKAAIEKYIMNRKEEIGSEVRPLKPKTINDGQREALEAEAWYEEKQQTRARSQIIVKRPIYHQLQQKPLMRFTIPNSNIPLAQRVHLKCNHFQKLGHVESQCHIKNKNFSQDQNQKRLPQRINITEEMSLEEI